jgi:hypothetical protein
LQKLPDIGKFGSGSATGRKGEHGVDVDGGTQRPLGDDAVCGHVLSRYARLFRRPLAPSQAAR